MAASWQFLRPHFRPINVLSHSQRSHRGGILGNCALFSMDSTKSVHPEVLDQLGPRNVLRGLMSVLAKNSKDDSKNVFIKNHIKKLYEESPQELSPSLRKILQTKSGSGKAPDEASEVLQFKSLMLGFSWKMIEERLEVLDRVGIQGKDAILISLSIPSSLSMTTEQFTGMVDLLRSWDCDIPKLLFQNPWVFSLSPASCEQKISLLKNSGFTRKDIRFLVESYPVVISFGIDAAVLEAAQKMEEFLQDSQITSSDNVSVVAKAIVMSLSWPGYFYNPEKINNDAKVFLEAHKVPVDEVFVRCPKFFQQDSYELHMVEDFLTREPIWFEQEHINELINHRPEAFIQLAKPQAQENLKILAKTLSTKGLLKFITSKGISLQNRRILGFINCLQKFGFSDQDVETLLCEKEGITSILKIKDDALLRKLSVLLSGGDYKPADIVDFYICLKINITHLENRLEYKRSKSSADLTLKETLLLSDKHFVSRVGDMDESRYRAFLEKRTADRKKSYEY